MSDEREYVEISDAEILRVTPRAVMIRSEELDVDEQWIPQTVVDWDESEATPKEGSSGSLFVEEWFAKREGLY